MSESSWVDDAHRIGKTLPPRVVVGRNGAFWRDYGDHYSMCPVSTDNDPVEPVATYLRSTQVSVRVDGIRREAEALMEMFAADTVQRACQRILAACDATITNDAGCVLDPVYEQDTPVGRAHFCEPHSGEMAMDAFGVEA